MKAAFFKDINSISVEDIPMYKVGTGDILIKMGATSVCGTDLRIFKNGHFKIPIGQKRVLGHELTGEIIEIGSNVKGYSKGMRIAVAPNIGCGICDECIQGMINVCKDYEAFGISIDGGFQEYVLIPEFAVKSGAISVIPDNLSFEEAAIAEPLSCVCNCFNRLNVKFSDTVLIIGAGPIGALHVALQKCAGVKKIMVADLSQQRLEAVKCFGADILINTSKVDLKEAVMNHTNNKGADIIITAASVGALQKISLELAAVNGRINFFAGLPSGNDKVEFNTNLIHYKQLCVYATTGSSYTDHRTSIDLISNGRIDVKPLISKCFSVSETEEAFKYAMSGQGMKTFIVGE